MKLQTTAKACLYCTHKSNCNQQNQLRPKACMFKAPKQTSTFAQHSCIAADQSTRQSEVHRGPRKLQLKPCSVHGGAMSDRLVFNAHTTQLPCSLTLIDNAHATANNNTDVSSRHPNDGPTRPLAPSRGSALHPAFNAYVEAKQGG